jgi:hypothetical protein
MRVSGRFKKLAAVTLAVMAMAAIAAAQEKPKVAVYVTDGGDKSMPAKALAMAGAHTVVGAALVKAINLTGKGEAVNFTKEITKGFGAQAGEAQAANIGRQFNVQSLCVVTISGIRGKSFNIGVKMIDVASGRITATGGPAPVDLSNPAGILTAMTNITVGLVSGMVVNAAAKAVVGPQAQPVQSTTPVAQQASPVQPAQAAMAAPPPPEQPARRVAVVYISGKEPEGAAGSHMVIGEELAKAMSISGNKVVNRTDDIRKLLAEEHGDTLNWSLDETRIKDIGKRFGVPYLCVVQILEVSGNSYYLIGQIVNAATAEARNKTTASSNLSNSGEMAAAAQEIAKELVGTGKAAEQQAQETAAAQQQLYSMSQQIQQMQQQINYIEQTQQAQPAAPPIDAGFAAQNSPAQLEKRAKMEAGIAMSSASYAYDRRYHSDSGGSSSGDSHDTSSVGIGQYYRFDLVYAEFYYEYQYFNNAIDPFVEYAVLLKVPFGPEAIRMTPFVGVSDNSMGTTLDLGGRIDIKFTSFLFWRSEYVFGFWEHRSSMWLKSSLGVNIDIGESLYLCPEIMYRWNMTTYDAYNNDRLSATTERSLGRLNWGFGVGYKF